MTTPATSVVAVGAAYVSLGTTSSGAGSPQGEIMSQPANSVIGHPIGMSPAPFYVPFGSTEIWAISLTGAVINVTKIRKAAAERTKTTAPAARMVPLIASLAALSPPTMTAI